MWGDLPKGTRVGIVISGLFALAIAALVALYLKWKNGALPAASVPPVQQVPSPGLPYALYTDLGDTRMDGNKGRYLKGNKDRELRSFIRCRHDCGCRVFGGR